MCTLLGTYFLNLYIYIYIKSLQYNQMQKTDNWYSRKKLLGLVTASELG